MDSTHNFKLPYQGYSWRFYPPPLFTIGQKQGGVKTPGIPKMLDFYQFFGRLRRKNPIFGVFRPSKFSRACGARKF